MKALLTTFGVCLPAAAQAMCMTGSAAGCCAAPHGGLMGGAAYAVIATLGYWVLLHAVKETSTCIKRIGDVLGSVLVIVGLLGLLCAVTGHIRSSLGRCCGGQPPAAAMPAPEPGQDMGSLPPGHPPVGGGAPAQKARKPK
jgi:hypothetical protein